MAYIISRSGESMPPANAVEQNCRACAKKCATLCLNTSSPSKAFVLRVKHYLEKFRVWKFESPQLEYENNRKHLAVSMYFGKRVASQSLSSFYFYLAVVVWRRWPVGSLARAHDLQSAETNYGTFFKSHKSTIKVIKVREWLTFRDI